MGSVLLEVKEVSERRVLQECEDVAKVFSVLGKLNVFIDIGDEDESKSGPEKIYYELGDGGDGSHHCMVKISSVLWSGDLLPALCNLLSLCTAIFVEFDIDDHNRNIEKLSFFNELVDYFKNNVSMLKSVVDVPVIHFYTRKEGLNVKSSKKAIDSMLQPEKGFSEEIGKRNYTRNILTSFTPHKEILHLHGHKESISKHASVRERITRYSPKRIQCLDLSGNLLCAYVSAMQRISLESPGTVLSNTHRTDMVDSVLLQIEEVAFSLFNNSGSLFLLDPSTVMRLRQDALNYYESCFSIATTQSILARKKLQSRIRACILEYRSSRLDRLRKLCEIKLEELTLSLLPETERHCSTSMQLELGESSRVYSQFLSFKNAFEKNIQGYMALDASVLISEGEVSENGDDDIVQNKNFLSSLTVFLELEKLESSSIKHDVLCSFIIKQLRMILNMGEAWVSAYELLVSSTIDKTQMLRRSISATEGELANLITTAVKEKEEADMIIVALMDTFEIAREEQSRQLDQKQKELDRLITGLDRTTRLNETDKEDLTTELMKVQKKIEEAQNKALELRQERENQTNSLQNDLLEEERKGHRWFRSTISKQHALLAEELALERQVNQVKSQHMEQVFTMESEHMRNLEKLRSAAQQRRQALRDDTFRQREKQSQEHESNMTALRSRIMELDSKLNAANFDADHRNDEDKGCIIM